MIVGPKVVLVLIKILYRTIGRLKLGSFARTRFANQILANSHTAQTADCDELYGGIADVVLEDAGGEV